MLQFHEKILGYNFWQENWHEWKVNEKSENLQCDIGGTSNISLQYMYDQVQSMSGETPDVFLRSCKLMG